MLFVPLMVESKMTKPLERAKKSNYFDSNSGSVVTTVRVLNSTLEAIK